MEHFFLVNRLISVSGHCFSELQAKEVKGLGYPAIEKKTLSAEPQKNLRVFP